MRSRQNNHQKTRFYSVKERPTANPTPSTWTGNKTEQTLKPISSDEEGKYEVNEDCFLNTPRDLYYTSRLAHFHGCLNFERLHVNYSFKRNCATDFILLNVVRIRDTPTRGILPPLAPTRTQKTATTSNFARIVTEPTQ